MVKIRIFLKSREYSRVTEQMAGWCGVEVEFENFVASHIWGLGSVSLLVRADGTYRDNNFQNRRNTSLAERFLLLDRSKESKLNSASGSAAA